ncbi:MAG TPA: amidohydrolase, partial [Flavihumibacter sp.]|nr:amidohydrolase [Flavihumibacter sp.]
MRKFPGLASGRKWQVLLALVLSATIVQAQPTFPVNGIADSKQTTYAFTHATVVVSPGTSLQNATLLVKEGKIIAAGTSVSIPRDAMLVDCKGKFIYPSFIDIYSDYGLPPIERATRGFNWGAPAQFNSNQKGAYGWNQAIRTTVDAVTSFSADDAKAKPLRDIGFGTVLSHVKDGIARGTGVLATLSDEKENKTILREQAAAFYSFSKGSSTQSYPGSLMGTIALLRQTFLDAKWYQNNAEKEGVNLSLQAFNKNRSLPQVFDANDKWADLRADNIG